MLAFLSSPNFLIALALALLWAVESYWPAAPKHPQRLRHAVRNLTLGASNVCLSMVVTTLLLAGVSATAAEAKIGVLHWLPATWPTTLLAIVLLDAWMYALHRAHHTLPWLWRLHRVHHSDAEMDVTSALRFHAGEVLLYGLLRLPVVMLLGLSLQQVLLYDVLLLPVIFFHHSNIRLPERFDRVLRVVITTPALHRVHHSRRQSECDSNYGSIFSWWDRALQTFCLRRDGTPVELGLEGWDRPEQQSLRGLLQAPFTNESSATTVWSPPLSAPAKSSRLR
jgi:sterol desaturase/sphingolipid hydroxylase (fatty acid hydroxylase superfamily)